MPQLAPRPATPSRRSISATAGATRLADPNAISAFAAAAAAALGRRADAPLRLARFGEPELGGWSATQLFDDGSIAVHADEVSGRCFVDVIAGGRFDAARAAEVAVAHFGGTATCRG